jgi:hypothetical protein
VGSAHTVNLAIRRWQLSRANHIPRSHPTERPSMLCASPFVHFQSRIASILDGSQDWT